MSKLTHLCLGACGVLVLIAGIVWMPISASAAQGDPHDGRPGQGYGYEENGYANHDDEEFDNERYNNERYSNERYSNEQYGNEQHGNEQHGNEQYGDSHSSCDISHKIALGENLTTIADKYGVSVEALSEENGIEDANLIVENQSLCIPEHQGDSHGDRQSYNDRESHGDQESYGNQDSYGDRNSNGQGHGEERDSYDNQPYMVPGKSYDPSTFGKQNDSHGDSEQSYGPQENGHGNQDEYKTEYVGVPGKAYDPNEDYGHQDNYRQQDHQDNYGPQRHEDDEPFDFYDDRPEDGSGPDETDEPTPGGPGAPDNGDGG